MPTCISKAAMAEHRQHMRNGNMFKSCKAILVSVAVSLGTVAIAHAQSVETPRGDVLLTVSGDIDVTNVDDSLQLDRAALKAIGGTAFETTTIWTDGVSRFEGVSLKAFADMVGADAGTFLATAINDYTVEIPVSDAVDGGPIIAYLKDGDEMSVRDKGPLWIVYPYDSSAAYRSEVIFSRSIWQLDRIKVVQ